MKEMTEKLSLLWGMMLAVNMYVLFVCLGVFGGFDSFIRGLDGLEIILSVGTLLAGYLCCEGCMKHWGGKRLRKVHPAKVFLGMIVVAVAYLLAIVIKPSSGKDELIRAMSSFDFCLLVCVEFVFGTLMVFMIQFFESLFLSNGSEN